MQCMDAAVFKCDGLCACQKEGTSKLLSLFRWSIKLYVDLKEFLALSSSISRRGVQFADRDVLQAERTWGLSRDGPSAK